MNRLIIVGNGFDLTHQLDTRYTDFLKWYLKKAFRSAITNGEFSDKLFSLKSPYRQEPRYFDLFKNTDEMIDFFWKNGQILKLISNKQFPVIEGALNYFENTCDIVKVSTLLRDLVTKTGEIRWVDIELAYYHRLITILNDLSIGPKAKAEKVNDINESLTCITESLAEYLKSLPDPEYNDTIACHLSEKIDLDEILEKTALKEKLRLERNVTMAYPENIKILNFNFTNSVYLYHNIKNRVAGQPQFMNIINIHGQLESPETHPLVFGFGDELDTNYKTMEDSPIKGFFKHAKSFAYFKNNEYSDLVRFIEQREFQVYVCGHSCGLSDRTLLNMIFEHDHCKSIKIFYHRFSDGSDTYRETSEEISRHFNNKIKMRNRLINHSRSKSLLD